VLISKGPDPRRRKPALFRGAQCVAAGLLSCAIFCAATIAADEPDLFEMTIEELGEVQIVSVSRRAEDARQAPSAIHVITAEEIRRSGYTTLPEILRLAPGVEVARNGAHSWTISIRGFNSDLSNKLLVLIDGRSVYSPLFAGVFWDAQDTLLADIERIEVISGPGSTLWGTNAVNGVINVITRSARETPGLHVEAGAGNEERAFAGLRYGWNVGNAAAARAYVKYADRDASQAPDGGDAFDGWQTSQAGFRVDWEPNATDRVKFQGDVYDATLSDLLRGDFTLGTLPGPDMPGDVDISGYNLLARWHRQFDASSGVRLQAYVDHTSRKIPGSFNERRDTLDLDFQQEFAAGNHQVVWGAGFRLTSDELDNTLFATFLPEQRKDATFRLFAQDIIGMFSDRLYLTLGLDLNHNDYTQFELHPTARLTWPVNERNTLWAAATRAVRIPARLNTDLELTAPVAVPGLPAPLYVNVFGNDDYRSEELFAKEVGYRILLDRNLSLDLTVFHNDYDHLQTQEAGALFPVGDPVEYFVLPAVLENGMEGETYGGSLVATWQVNRHWRLQLQYARLEMDLQLKPGSTNPNDLSIAGNSPKHQSALHSSIELPWNMHFFTAIRYQDELPNLGVPDRMSIDVSLGWWLTNHLRLSLTARDVNDPTHPEFGNSNLIERSVYLKASWTH
jgi:iron complex outermembrane receptor protein